MVRVQGGGVIREVLDPDGETGLTRLRHELVAALGGIWIYQDARNRGMDTADMWAVGFFVGFFLLPIVGGILVFAYYLQKRDPEFPQPGGTPGQ